MECVAIIAEFNPFHRGHALLLKAVKEAFPEHAVIAVMSGNTVQRGDLAVFDKYLRARIAVENGYDAVFELPFPFSCSAAEQFASAGAYIANALGASVLAFGSESGRLETLIKTAENLSSAEFTSAFNEFVQNNREISVISARDNVYQTVFGNKLPIGSNDILALEYLRAMQINMYPMTPYAVHRVENYKATDARAALKHGEKAEMSRLLPYEADISEMNGGLRALSPLVLGLLRLDLVSDNGNGIVNSLKACARQAGSYEGFLSLLPTKTYTLARLHREILASIFSVTDEMKNEKPEFTVLLAAGKRGQSYISGAKKSFALPVITRMSDTKSFGALAEAQLQKALQADSVYRLGFNRPASPIPFQAPYMEK